MTIQTIMTFILINRKNKVFKDWMPQQIMQVINEHIDSGTIYVVSNKVGEIAGVVTFTTISPEDKIVEVTNILTDQKSKGVLKHFAKQFNKAFGSGWTVVGDFYRGYKELPVDKLAAITS